MLVIGKRVDSELRDVPVIYVDANVFTEGTYGMFLDFAKLLCADKCVVLHICDLHNDIPVKDLMKVADKYANVLVGVEFERTAYGVDEDTNINVPEYLDEKGIELTFMLSKARRSVGDD